GRTRAPALDASDGDPRDAWAAYALDAELMCVREPGSQDWTVPAGVTFRDWLRDGGSGTLRAPTAEDLDYHLSTLFPPVRPRGHMELRMIDAQPGDGGTARPGNPARDHRAGTDRRTAADLFADRQRGRGRPGQTALAAHVPAGLGPRAHRQPGRALAAARGRRARADAPGDRPA